MTSRVTVHQKQREEHRKNVVKTGMEVASDVIDGRSFTDSVKERVPATIKRGV